ncbi:response regulator [Paenibacillus rigui]|uniref:DNA-binding response regulator n=1 Tax=Paenibacillus rigui TaxID=554312 RepID=A0A229UGP9_9BACL|nr:response regulator [Paenibacillus rigui]OXM82568.1 DNA-binding response regulator [Paenibacillus rigui]
MKMLIVDDESPVRRTVRKLIHWRELGIETILEADNGTEAMKLIQTERPQIVIMDIMMPVTTGLDLMKWMDTHAPACKKIIISGYSDFEYARTTVKYGGIDYLLKPIDRLQLQAAAEKAIRSAEETSHRQTMQLEAHPASQEVKRLVQEKLLSKLLSDAEKDFFNTVWGPLMQEFPQFVGIKNVRVGVLDLKLSAASDTFHVPVDTDSFLNLFADACNAVLHDSDNGIAFRSVSRREEVILLLWNSTVASSSLVKQISARMEPQYSMRMNVGISEEHSFPSTLQKAYTQAQIALRCRNLLDTATSIHEFRECDVLPLVTTLGFGNFGEEIRFALLSGSAVQIRNVIQTWFASLSTLDSITAEQFDMWRDEYRILRTRWMETADPSVSNEGQLMHPELGLPLDGKGEFSFHIWQKELLNDLLRLSQYLKAPHSKSRNVIHEIVRYLKLHYTQDISLQELSDMFHLNRDYISRKFKQEFHETIIDYVIRLRMEKAKVLLMNPHLKIVQVAEMVGYEDEKYFSRVFKKCMGQSPNHYRLHTLPEPPKSGED